LRLLSKLNHAHSVIHIETAPWQSWLFLVALSVMGARVFLTFHNAPVPPSRYRELIWKARLAVVSRLPGIYFFAANRDTRERLKRLLPPTALERMIVTPASVDPDEIERAAQNLDRSSLRWELSIPDTDFVILSVGRFIDRKGRWVLLEAAREVVQAAPDCTFLWLTPDAPPIEDMRRVEGYGLGAKFRVITSSQVASNRLAVLGFYKIADTFVLPSFLEGLPIALLEAMAMGLPVIATDIYAIPEAVSGGETGLLVMAGEASLLAEAVMRYKRDPSLRARMAEDGRRHVLANFRADETAAIAMDAYRRAFAHAG
jgi:colanic acid/amylovoran biosynthesis glycosyltransferase